MEGLSAVCQYPRCAKKARFCCEKCLKRTYCSDRCQLLDWKTHKTQCIENEKKEEIIKDITAAKEKYGSVFNKPATKPSTKRSNSSAQKKANRKKAKVEIEYNGCLLPHCLEAINNCLVRFLNSMESHLRYGSFCSNKVNELYHTSSISETAQLLQIILNRFCKDERKKLMKKREINKSPKEMMQVVIEFAEHFEKQDLVDEFKQEDLYASWNDYTQLTEERKFCSHCGDKENLEEHPKLRYVYLCKDCLNVYSNNQWEQEDDHDVDCCCCADGGDVVLCDSCSHSMCSNCIMLHMGAEEWEHVVQDDHWECFLCKKGENGKLFAKEDSSE